MTVYISKREENKPKKIIFNNKNVHRKRREDLGQKIILQIPLFPQAPFSRLFLLGLEKKLLPPGKPQ